MDQPANALVHEKYKKEETDQYANSACIDEKVRLNL
jgi:hypothetical protein